MISRLACFYLFGFLLFSCTSPDVQENNNIENIDTDIPIKPSSDKLINEKIITIYSKENQLEIWENTRGKLISKKTIEIEESNLPLGIQKIKSIDEHQISFQYSNTSPYSIDNIITINSGLGNVDEMDNYTLIIVPSRPNEYGTFEGCLKCPHWTREMALKSKLEWESIFGHFQNIH